MKISVKKFSAAALVFLLALAMIPGFAFAATDSVSVNIPVSVKINGDAPSTAEDYTIKLAAQSENAPMPSRDTITVNGEGKSEFPDITFEKPGVYNYTLFQIAGSSANCKYDSTVYDVVITVTNSNTKEGFDVVVAVKVNDEKYDCAQFVNEYEKIPQPENYTSLTVKKVWRDNGKNRPDTVTVQLLDGKNVKEEITLSEKNGWTYTWDKLEEGHSWSVAEANIPKGYTASYNIDKNVTTITNTYSQNVLIQTGQLNYPIPILLCAGAVFMIIGTALGKKRNKKDA